MVDYESERELFETWVKDFLPIFNEEYFLINEFKMYHNNTIWLMFQAWLGAKGEQE